MHKINTTAITGTDGRPARASEVTLPEVDLGRAIASGRGSRRVPVTSTQTRSTNASVHSAAVARYIFCLRSVLHSGGILYHTHNG